MSESTPAAAAPAPVSPACRPTNDAEIRRRNRLVMSVYEFAWGLAMPFLLIATMHTGYLDALGVGPIAIGVVPAVFAAGYSLVGPVSAARLTGRRAFAVTLASYLFAAAGMAGVGALGVLAPDVDPGLRFLVYALGLLAWTIGLGLGDPHYIAFALEAAEPGRRGRFFARRWLCLGVGGVIGGELSRRLLEAVPKPEAYAWGFLAGGAFLFVVTLPFAAFRVADAPAPAPGAGAFAAMRGFLAEPTVRRLLIAFCLFTVGQQVFPFLALALTHRTAAGTDPGFVGMLNTAFMLATAVWAPAVGRLSDTHGSRFGFVLMVVLFAAGMLGSVALANLPTGAATPAMVVAAAGLCYFAASVWQPGTGIVFSNMITEAARGVPAAQALAMMGLVLLPLRLTVSPAAGWAIGQFDYGPALMAAAAAALAALLCPAAVPRGPDRPQ
jgi:MFS family permease